MYQPYESSAFAFTASDANFPSNPKPNPHNETVRHLLYGSPQAVQATIKNLHRRGYAEPNEWSRPMPTDRPGEVMRILTKTVWIE